MPTYEYRCAKGHTFERFQKMSDPPEATCPECGGPAERVVSGGAGFVFKGAGFYITDYRSDDYKSKARTENPGAESKPTPSGSEKGESKGRPDKMEKSKDAPASKPAPLKTKPAPPETTRSAALPHSGHFAAGGSDIFWKRSKLWPLAQRYS